MAVTVAFSSQGGRGIGSKDWLKMTLLVRRRPRFPFHERRCGLALGKAVADSMRSAGLLRWKLQGSGDGQADDQQRVAYR